MDIDFSIVLILFKPSVVAKAVERKLKECDYNVITVVGEFDKIKEMAESALLFVTYLPGDIADDQEEMDILDNIQEQLWNTSTNMLLIGEKKDRPRLMQHNHRLEHFAWLDRPLKMDELEKIYRVITREYEGAEIRTYLVIDATTGQNGLQQAKMFAEVTKVSGIVLTKLDGTAKGGIAVAIQDELGLPVSYIGVGEGIDDLQAFDAASFVDAIF